MATPEMASSAPIANVGVMRSPRNNTLEIRNYGDSALDTMCCRFQNSAITQLSALNRNTCGSDSYRHFGAARMVVEGLILERIWAHSSVEGTVDSTKQVVCDEYHSRPRRDSGTRNRSRA